MTVHWSIDGNLRLQSTYKIRKTKFTKYWADDLQWT